LPPDERLDTSTALTASLRFQTPPQGRVGVCDCLESIAWYGSIPAVMGVLMNLLQAFPIAIIDAASHFS
jgi:hypothetical protein